MSTYIQLVTPRNNVINRVSNIGLNTKNAYRLKLVNEDACTHSEINHALQCVFLPIYCFAHNFEILAIFQNTEMCVQA